MGKAGRFACVFTPMALTLASFICLVLVMYGQTKSDQSLSQKLYFFRANTANFTDNPDPLPNTNIDNNLLSALQNSAKDKDLKDFYEVGLWNYCEGDIKNGDYKTTYCSKISSTFWFDPITTWDLKNATSSKIFPKALQDGLDAYKKVSKWMLSAFAITFFATIAEFVIGFFAICSRWGSFVTTIISSIQTFFYLAAAITATALYGALAGTFDSALKPYKIKASLGKQMYVTLWLGAAFSIASGFFWLISICCCSGKSGHKRVNVEKTPYTYERVASPYLGAQEGHQMGHVAAAGHSTTGSAYEPFRHQGASA